MTLCRVLGVMTRRLSEQKQEQIKELVLKGYRDTSISNKLKTPRTTVVKYTKIIRENLQANRKLIIESFDYEYQKLNESFDLRKERINERMDKTHDPRIIMDCEKLLHQIDIDKWKLLGDSDIVLAVRRMRDERISKGITERTS